MDCNEEAVNAFRMSPWIVISWRYAMSSFLNIYLGTKQGHVAEDGVKVHEDILDHDVDVRPGALDDVLIVDPGKHRAQNL